MDQREPDREHKADGSHRIPATLPPLQWAIPLFFEGEAIGARFAGHWRGRRSLFGKIGLSRRRMLAHRRCREQRLFGDGAAESAGRSHLVTWDGSAAPATPSEVQPA